MELRDRPGFQIQPASCGSEGKPYNLCESHSPTRGRCSHRRQQDRGGEGHAGVNCLSAEWASDLPHTPSSQVISLPWAIHGSRRESLSHIPAFPRP